MLSQLLLPLTLPRMVDSKCNLMLKLMRPTPTRPLARKLQLQRIDGSDLQHGIIRAQGEPTFHTRHARHLGVVAAEAGVREIVWTALGYIGAARVVALLVCGWPRVHEGRGLDVLEARLRAGEAERMGGGPSLADAKGVDEGRLLGVVGDACGSWGGLVDGAGGGEGAAAEVVDETRGLWPLGDGPVSKCSTDDGRVG